MYFFKTVRTMLFFFCILTIMTTIRSIFAFFNVLFIESRIFIIFKIQFSFLKLTMSLLSWYDISCDFGENFLDNQISFVCICLCICICICVCICIYACNLSCFLHICELLRWFLRILHDLWRLRNLRLLQDLWILCHLLCVDFLFNVFSILLNQL